MGAHVSFRVQARRLAASNGAPSCACNFVLPEPSDLMTIDEWAREMPFIREQVRAWPKVELHRHLEGSVRFETALDLARQNGIVAPGDDPADFDAQVRWQPDECPDFRRFLDKFRPLRRLYTSRAAVERVTQEAIADAAADNICYLELRFNPDHYAESLGCSLETATEWIITAANEEAHRQQMMVRYLLTINRTYEQERAEATVEAALRYQSAGVVGIDLAGDEVQNVAFGFAHLFRRGAAAGLGITIHAGEAGPAANVWTALGLFSANRIGHGVQSVADPFLLSMLAARRVVLEVCPTSNVQTGAVPSLAAHPLKALLAAGVPVTLGTDDPSISRTTLTDEYALALGPLGLAPGQLRQVIFAGAHHAFLSPDERAALVVRLRSEFAALES